MKRIAYIAGVIALPWWVWMPQAQADTNIVEQCHWDNVNWVYSDGSLCRGTGEDPTTDARGLPACANGRAALISLYTGRVSCLDHDGDPDYDFPNDYDASEPPSSTVTVDGTDYPVCYEEDCSDQANQVGVWTNNQGISYLELGESVTLRIEQG